MPRAGNTACIPIHVVRDAVLADEVTPDRGVPVLDVGQPLEHAAALGVRLEVVVDANDAGAVAALLPPSPWFLLTVGFLAIEKRKAELRVAQDRGVITRKVLKRYSLPLLLRLLASPSMAGAQPSPLR